VPYSSVLCIDYMSGLDYVVGLVKEVNPLGGKGALQVSVPSTRVLLRFMSYL